MIVYITLSPQIVSKQIIWITNLDFLNIIIKVTDWTWDIWLFANPPLWTRKFTWTEVIFNKTQFSSKSKWHQKPEFLSITLCACRSLVIGVYCIPMICFLFVCLLFCLFVFFTNPHCTAAPMMHLRLLVYALEPHWPIAIMCSLPAN